MSLFRNYTPRKLYVLTLKLVNSLFHESPPIQNSPSSYFNQVLVMHRIIRQDLSGILQEVKESEEAITVAQIHSSLVAFELQLFGTESAFDIDLRGCCLYTQFLERRLTTYSTHCVLS